MKGPVAEQVEAGAAVHGTLDGLQPVDPPLDGPSGPAHFQCRLNGRQVLPESGREALQRRPGGGGQPIVERARSLLAHQRREAVREVTDLAERRDLRQQLVHERPVSRGQIPWIGLQQARHALDGWGLPGLGA